MHTNCAEYQEFYYFAAIEPNNPISMPRFFLTDEINMMLSASRFLRMYRDKHMRQNILKVRYVPPVLGSDSFGSYKVTFKNEPKQRTKQFSAIK